MEDKLDARDAIIAGLRQRIELLTTRNGNEVEKKLAEQTHVLTIFGEQAA